MKSWPTFKSTKNCFHVFFLDVRFFFFWNLTYTGQLHGRRLQRKWCGFLRVVFVSVRPVRPALRQNPSTLHCHFWNALDWTQSESQWAPRRVSGFLSATSRGPQHLGRMWQLDAKITIEPCGGSKLDLQTTSFEIPWFLRLKWAKVLYFFILFLVYSLSWNLRYEGIIKQCQCVTILSELPLGSTILMWPHVILLGLCSIRTSIGGVLKKRLGKRHRKSIQHTVQYLFCVDCTVDINNKDINLFG